MIGTMALTLLLAAASGSGQHEDRTRAYFDPELVPAWNKRAYEIGFAEDRFLTWKAHRAFALMHLAMHDALNAVAPVYRRYVCRRLDPRAHPLAAAAQAAYQVLLSQYPAASAELTAELDRSLVRIPDGPARRRGIALGKVAAAALLASRLGDGWDREVSYTFQDVAGAYQTTPDWKGFVAHPGFRLARPFGLRSSTQLRPPPPPALASPEYAAAYNEVKERGRAENALRTPEQTAYAVWWMEFAEGSWNRLARSLVAERRIDPWRAARLFALLAMSLYDGYVAVWDAKFEYNHWRPYTAIRQADQDGNPATAPDPAWVPLRPPPPFPEYVSAHASGCAASAEILARTFGAAVPFSMSTITAPAGMPRRRFASFEAAARECADSRVQLGWHFRYATDAGLTLGRRVAAQIADHHLRPYSAAN
jgi:hypothetical protein